MMNYIKMKKQRPPEGSVVNLKQSSGQAMSGIQRIVIAQLMFPRF